MGVFLSSDGNFYGPDSTNTHPATVQCLSLTTGHSGREQPPTNTGAWKTFAVAGSYVGAWVSEKTTAEAEVGKERVANALYILSQ